MPSSHVRNLERHSPECCGFLSASPATQIIYLLPNLLQMKMDPTAFRAQLLQNFRVRLGPGELGAVFTAFDKDNSKLIDGTEVQKTRNDVCPPPQEHYHVNTVCLTVVTRISCLC